MTDPLSEEARRLASEEAALDEPTAEEVEALRMRVYSRLGVTPPEAPPAAPGPATATAAPGGALSVPLVVAGIAAVGAALYLAPSSWDESAPRPTTAAEKHPREEGVIPSPVVPRPRAGPPVLVPSSSASVERLDAPAPKQGPAARRAAPAPRAAVDPTSPQQAASAPLGEEALLIATAEAHLAGGHTARALALFDRHLAEYPRGVHRWESEAGRVRALCRLGRLEEGRGALARLEASTPTSPHLARLRAECRR